MDNVGEVKFGFIQVSDLHISTYRNLLEPMVSAINAEKVGLVVVTGDLVQSPTEELFKIAKSTLDKIKHQVIVIPGDYDGGEMWESYFGNSYSSWDVGDYVLDFLDTSYLKHSFASGWSDSLEEKDYTQYAWFTEQLKLDKYHIVFSHHPFWVSPLTSHKLLTNNVRAIFSGHLHEPVKFYFGYNQPRRHFDHGFGCTPAKFHGNSCYVLNHVKKNDEISNFLRSVVQKRTAW